MDNAQYGYCSAYNTGKIKKIAFLFIFSVKKFLISTFSEENNQWIRLRAHILLCIDKD